MSVQARTRDGQRGVNGCAFTYISATRLWRWIAVLVLARPAPSIGVVWPDTMIRVSFVRNLAELVDTVGQMFADVREMS